MNWKVVDDKLKKRYGRNLVICDDYIEREFIIDQIKLALPYYTRLEIKEAVDICCKTAPSPAQRDVFLQCVRETLEANA
jgi:hypothetical protein